MLQELKKRLHNQKSIEMISARIIAIIFFIVFFIYFFTANNTTSKPKEYMEALAEKIRSVSNNPSVLISGNGEVIIRDGTIKYTVENEGYLAVAEYDMSYNLQSMKIDDKAVSPLALIFISLFISGVFTITVYTCSIVVISLISQLYTALSKKKKE